LEQNRGLQKLAETSFNYMVSMLSFKEQLEIATPDTLEFRKVSHLSVMITISSSVFRIPVLLHVPILKEGTNSLIPLLNFDDKQDVPRQYIDYISELCNNLCGFSARLLQASGFSTGLSQPSILSRAYGDAEIGAVNSQCTSHLTSTMNGILNFAASYTIFVNRNHQQEVTLNIVDMDDGEDANGELEFF